MARRVEVNCRICHSFSHLTKDHKEKIIGFNEKDGDSEWFNMPSQGSKPAWLIEKSKLVPVVSVEFLAKLLLEGKTRILSSDALIWKKIIMESKEASNE